MLTLSRRGLAFVRKRRCLLSARRGVALLSGYRFRDCSIYQAGIASGKIALPSRGTDRAFSAHASEDKESTKVLREFLSLMPLVYNTTGNGPVDEALAGSSQRAAGEEFHFTIGPADALIVIDVQNDFVARGPFNEEGGRLAAPEADAIAKAIADMMLHFNEHGGMVVATRDYHPSDHVSFVGHRGALPVHCIAGHIGSFLFRPIATAMETCMAAAPDKSFVAFKGFHEDIDSFGGLTYSEEDAANRESREGLHALPRRGDGQLLRGEVHPEVFTGCMVLKCSGMNVEGQFDANAPPDILAATGGNRKLEDILIDRGIKRVFVCGVVTDFCVLDTTCNAAQLGFEDVYMVIDATRPVYIPASDFFQAPYGSGFQQDPKSVKKKVVDYGAKFCFMQDLLPDHVLSASPEASTHQVAASRTDPSAFLSSWKLHHAPALVKHFVISELPGEQSNGKYSIVGHDILESLGISGLGLTGPKAKVNLPSELRKSWEIPEDVTHYCWCYGLEGARMFDQHDRFAWIVNEPTFRFFGLGGFAYFSSDGQVRALLAVGGAGGSDMSINFSTPTSADSDLSQLIARQRCVEPRCRNFRDRGVKKIGWLGNDELGCKHGGFIFEMENGIRSVYAVLDR
eukprot:TRINITY_DN74805_c0_g1_i1.p1 TRINITY_DN74805_c0_g1~~TRINITY_DN74805_c0_g1_i1.p1  ORF type:complete len:627 (-),score=69.63 TRINITY_DN74805_c0_g1_i1:9-1889(-)